MQIYQHFISFRYKFKILWQQEKYKNNFALYWKINSKQKQLLKLKNAIKESGFSNNSIQRIRKTRLLGMQSLQKQTKKVHFQPKSCPNASVLSKTKNIPFFKTFVL